MASFDRPWRRIFWSGLQYLKITDSEFKRIFRLHPLIRMRQDGVFELVDEV